MGIVSGNVFHRLRILYAIGSMAPAGYFTYVVVIFRTGKTPEPEARDWGRCLNLNNLCHIIW
jgi:hypothetical protein